MLMTELRLGQTLTIDDTVVKMVSYKGGRVKLAIDVSDGVKIRYEKKDTTHNDNARGIKK